MKTKLLLFFTLLLLSCTGSYRSVSAPESENEVPAVFKKGNFLGLKNNEATDKIILKAKITRIVDGDTVEILYGNLPLMLRLAHIDAPETRGDQPFGEQAEKALYKLCFGQEVVILTKGDFDMGGRMIAEIINNNGINVNKEMVRLGYAWHYKKYSDDNTYHALEKIARKNQSGLWQAPNPIAPWNFR